MSEHLYNQVTDVSTAILRVNPAYAEVTQRRIAMYWPLILLAAFSNSEKIIDKKGHKVHTL